MMHGFERIDCTPSLLSLDSTFFAVMRRLTRPSGCWLLRCGQLEPLCAVLDFLPWQLRRDSLDQLQVQLEVSAFYQTCSCKNPRHTPSRTKSKQSKANATPRHATPCHACLSCALVVHLWIHDLCTSRSRPDLQDISSRKQRPYLDVGHIHEHSLQRQQITLCVDFLDLKRMHHPT